MHLLHASECSLHLRRVRHSNTEFNLSMKFKEIQRKGDLSHVSLLETLVHIETLQKKYECVERIIQCHVNSPQNI